MAAGHAFREVTIGDSVVGYLSSPACANAETRRHHFGILGLLADELGMVRPLAQVSPVEVADAVARLWGRPHRRRR